jgi:peptide/nickel transport system permease protein
MRLIDVVLALPIFVLVLAVGAIAPRGVLSVILVIGFLGWVVIARIVRMQFFALRSQEFVVAATAVGVAPWRVALRHLLPNALPPVLAIASFEVAGAILTEASLSFLGVGVPPSTPTWGNVLAGGQQHLLLGLWWTVYFPATALTLTVVAINLIADHFRLSR